MVEDVDTGGIQVNWREDESHLAECPECFTALHFNMPEWRCNPCPRLLYQNASNAWYQHLKNCDACQQSPYSCETGEPLLDKCIEWDIRQSDAGCSSLFCAGKDLQLRDCPGVDHQEDKSSSEEDRSPGTS